MFLRSLVGSEGVDFRDDVGVGYMDWGSLVEGTNFMFLVRVLVFC